MLQTPTFKPCPKPPARAGERRINALTVDVEEHFQVHALTSQFPRDGWGDIESRVEANTRRILDLFDAGNAKATFFILGWVAERFPGLVRDIADAGHEIGSHGMCHIRADEQSHDEFREDIRQSKRLLEDAGGTQVNGFRAASFSVSGKNLWAFNILAEEGYSYSSSINPVHHDHYGMPDAPRFPFYPLEHTGFREIPISTIRAMNHNLPCGGGGYFRLLPYAYSKFAIRRVNHTDDWPFMFYFHPWEIDAEQPRAENVSLKSRFRHYTNLDKMEARLNRLFGDFSWDRIDRVFLDRHQ